MGIQEATNELYRCFQLLNESYFEGQLPLPAITIQSKGRRDAFGWCSSVEIWRDRQDTDKRYEINIAAEHLDRDPIKTVETLLHEMVHLYCATKGIKDCSRGGRYHNAKFRDAAEQHGMTYEDPEISPKYGWAFPTLRPSTKTRIETWSIDPKAFLLARHVPETAKKRANNYKLECPSCGIKLRATKPGIVVICKDCGVELVEC